MTATRIENWAVVVRGGPYTPPELCSTVLAGNVYGHPDPRFEDGDFVKTSRILSMDGEAGWAQTKSRLYELGAPDPKFIDYLKSRGKTIADYKEDVDEKTPDDPS